MPLVLGSIRSISPPTSFALYSSNVCQPGLASVQVLPQLALLNEIVSEAPPPPQAVSDAIAASTAMVRGRVFRMATRKHKSGLPVWRRLRATGFRTFTSYIPERQVIPAVLAEVGRPGGDGLVATPVMAGQPEAVRSHGALLTRGPGPAVTVLTTVDCQPNGHRHIVRG